MSVSNQLQEVVHLPFYLTTMSAQPAKKKRKLDASARTRYKHLGLFLILKGLPPEVFGDEPNLTILSVAEADEDYYEETNDMDGVQLQLKNFVWETLDHLAWGINCDIHMDKKVPSRITLIKQPLHEWYDGRCTVYFTVGEPHLPYFLGIRGKIGHSGTRVGMEMDFPTKRAAEAVYNAMKNEYTCRIDGTRNLSS